MIYIIWTIVTLGLATLGFVEFKPVYTFDDMSLPLFSDITAIALWLPSYFILLWYLVHIICVFTDNSKTRAIIIALLLTVGFSLSLNLLDFYSIVVKIVVSFVAMSIAFIHFYITTFLFRKSRFFKKQDSL